MKTYRENPMTASATHNASDDLPAQSASVSARSIASENERRFAARVRKFAAQDRLFAAVTFAERASTSRGQPMPHDAFCDCEPCRYPRVLARFRSEPQVYDDYAKLVAWWCYEREHRAEISEGSVFSLVESPLPKPNAALEVLR